MKRMATLALLLALAFPDSSAAQAFGGGVRLQGYTFDDPEMVGLGSFTLFTLPFAASVPAGDWFTLNLSGAFARGEAEGPSGGSASLAGLTDTEVGIHIPLGGDRAVFTLGATLPTGKTDLTLEEAAVASAVANELLPFSLTTWGLGGTIGGDLALAFAGDGWGIGLSGGYRGAMEYDPLALEAFTYRPGNQIRFRLALDKTVGEAGTLSLLLGIQHFGEDQVEGNNLFQAGARVDGVLSYAFPFGLRGSGLVYGGVLHRENGTVLLEVPGVERATSPASQDLFLGGSNLRLPVGRRAILLPAGEIRVFRAADGVGQGWVGSAGGALEVRLSGQSYGRHLILSPSARFRLGGVTIREGEDTTLKGWEVGLTLRMEVGP